MFVGVFSRKHSDVTSVNHSGSLCLLVFISRKHCGVMSVNHSGSLCLLVFLVENTVM